MSDDLLNKINRALLDIKDQQFDTFEITWEEEEGKLNLFLGDHRGTYMLAKDKENGFITMFSPISGFHQYMYDHDNEWWCSVQGMCAVWPCLWQEWFCP
jgi:frataxin-like iron-binding protein CyaY